MPRHAYPAKVLILGEYTVLLGGTALALPHAGRSAHWAAADKPDPRLLAYADWLAERQAGGEAMLAGFDAGAMRRWVGEERQHFHSNIPFGYGLGSSGSLCAAVYERFFAPKTTALESLRGIFATMEQHFHGTSSGFDPLVPYLGRGVLRGPKGLAIWDGPVSAPEGLAFYLVDSRQARQTGPLVALFFQNLEEGHFRDACQQELMPANSAALDALAKGDAAALWAAWQAISALQWAYFRPMIPPGLQDLWQAGLASGRFLLKLCGAGGGGYTLALVRDGLPDAQAWEILDNSE